MGGGEARGGGDVVPFGADNDTLKYILWLLFDLLSNVSSYPMLDFDSTFIFGGCKYFSDSYDDACDSNTHLRYIIFLSLPL